MSEQGQAFQRFVDVIAKLRDPVGGCPWDLEQTHNSIRQYLVEETYELLEAIDDGSDRALCEELGDLLLQVVLHAQIATDRGAFSIGDVVASVTEKMIRRHPHVFGATTVSGSAEVLRNWETIKAGERAAKGDAGAPAPSLLDGVPRELPALIRAQRIGEKAAKARFDWERTAEVRAKVSEELAEVDQEIAALKPIERPLTTAPKDRPENVQRALEDEIGDLLFSICQLSRWLGVSAEDSLRGTIDKFNARFRHMEASSLRKLDELNPSELDALWTAAKDRTK